jgi:uncharacterized protein (TIGR02147 family)
MQIERQNLHAFSDPVDWLRAEYVRRRKKNPQYSLRAFARQLKLPVGSVSEFLSRKRSLTRRTGERLARSLELSPGERERLLSLISDVRNASKSKQGDELATTDTIEYREVSQDIFNLVADWYHFGILALMDTADFKMSPAWIAGKLKISVTEVRDAIDRMIRLGLLRETDSGFVAVRRLTSSHDIPSLALRKFHLQLLQKAERSLEEDEVERRDITSITMAVDISLLPEAKKKIEHFRRQLSRFLEGGRQTEVYHLNIQLIPATQSGDGTEEES